MRLSRQASSSAASALLVATALGCASGKGGQRSDIVSSTTQRVAVSSGDMKERAMVTNRETVSRTAQIPTTPDRTWKVMADVYTELGIPVGFVTQEERKIGNEQFKVRRRLGSTNLSRYLDCGSGSSGQNAETYEVTMTVVTVVAPSPAEAGSSAVTTFVDGTARSLNYTDQQSTCATTGQLERRIEETIREKIKG